MYPSPDGAKSLLMQSGIAAKENQANDKER
jgi:hypothetical protein